MRSKSSGGNAAPIASNSANSLRFLHSATVERVLLKCHSSQNCVKRNLTKGICLETTPPNVPPCKIWHLNIEGNQAKPKIEKLFLEKRTARLCVAYRIFVRRGRHMIDGGANGERKRRAKPISSLLLEEQTPASYVAARRGQIQTKGPLSFPSRFQ